ncbi:MaoC/PaaZ C-terminal domain-containing protein [Gammaproteobacteria bacterium]|nr:MaoC/PaaZ C-terminal domain-containing protein [Gammaproteobacteria bacterium]
MNLKRTFSIENQTDFASFSGDYNPIHINEKESIRTHAGQPIVHGVHMVLWALDAFRIDLKANSNIDINFTSQVNLNTEVQAVLNKTKNEILIFGDSEVKYCSIKIRKLSTIKIASVTNKDAVFDISNHEPDDLEIDNIREGQKFNNLYGGSKKHLGKNIFPYLVKSYGLNFVYEIACISSIVGMKVPGNHSLFLNLGLSFTSDNKNKYFIINTKHDILRLCSISYYGLNLNAEIKALFRPKPTLVSSISALKKEFDNHISLKNKKVLVIGGSRGIGAYVTKLCSIMGASVTFTYNSQNEEAVLIEKEILINGGKANCRKMNVLDNNDIEMLDDNFDYIFYFATPKISPNSSKEINKKMADYFSLFYVDAFKNIVKKFSSLDKKIKYLYPSTSYIDDNKKDFREYISSKLEGEILCESYNKEMIGSFFYPRLPPLDTDQNLSIVPTKNNKASEFALNIITLMTEHEEV